MKQKDKLKGDMLKFLDGYINVLQDNLNEIAVLENSDQKYKVYYTNELDGLGGSTGYDTKTGDIDMAFGSDTRANPDYINQIHLGSKYPDENLPKKGTLIVIKVPLQRVFRSEVWLNEENGIRPITTDGYRAVYILKRAGG